MTTLRIVQLANGKFAVQVQERLWGEWEFCENPSEDYEGRYGNKWWRVDHVLEYCMCNTQKEAEMVLDITLMKLRAEKAMHIKVIKVIKKVKV